MIKLIFLCIAGFIAAFVDSIAGGGGVISVPAFMLAGLSPHLTLGTNKFAATTGSLTSSIKFAKSGLCDFYILKRIIPFTILGAFLGVKLVLFIDQSFLQPLVLILIVAIGIYTFFSKNIGKNDNFTGFTSKNLLLGIVLGFSLGFYDGFFGPGTGSFLVFLLIKIYGFNFVRAAANGKILNFASNVTSLITFAFGGSISYLYGIPVAIFMILGARIGTKMAINKGSKLIRPLFITMSLAVAVKLVIEMF